MPYSVTPEAYFALLRSTFQNHGDPLVAQGQMAYMRRQFEFFGLKMPAWMALTKAIHREQGLPAGEDLKTLVRLCFADEHRELHYFALETVQKTLKTQQADFVDFLEELICTQSWWDTVDWLSKLVGLHFLRFPELIGPVTERWMDSRRLWLQRVCLLFQLLYRDKTDAELLFGYIRRLADSKEFFLRKGAAWALREYSKTDAEAVLQFIHSTPLAPLTRREGLKWLLKKRNVTKF